MTVARLRFVDSVSATPTVLLDLNDAAPFWLGEGWSFPPPPLRSAFAGTLLRDGQPLAASAYDNRELTIPLAITPGDHASLAAAYTTLHRLLDRDSVWLEFRLHPTLSESVFFRVLRSPEYAKDFATLGLALEQVTLTLTAEPFALGVETTALANTTINNDPAAGTNPMYAAVTGIVGDVPAPMLMKVRAVGGNTLLSVAIRSRGGTPPGLPFFGQAESATLGTDTTSQAITGFSAGNGARVSFATVATMATRLTATVFGASGSADLIGDYRIIVRVARNGGAATDDFQLRGYLGGYGSTVTVSDLTGPQLVDLGVFTLGRSTTGGYGTPFISGVDGVIVQAARIAGTGSLDIDYILAIPADTAYTQVDFGTYANNTFPGWLDGPNDSVYTASSGNSLVNTSFSRVGSIPLLVPNQTNWLYVIRSRSTTDDQIADQTQVSATYWPRYLYIAA